jgi:hypothetical protein
MKCPLAAIIIAMQKHIDAKRIMLHIHHRLL